VAQKTPVIPISGIGNSLTVVKIPYHTQPDGRTDRQTW